MNHTKVYVILSAIAAVILVGGFILYAIGLAGFCPPVKPEICMEIYSPVFGIPTFRMHANSCFACSEGAWMWFKIAYAGVAAVSAAGVIMITRSRRSGSSRSIPDRQEEQQPRGRTYIPHH